MVPIWTVLCLQRRRRLQWIANIVKIKPLCLPVNINVDHFLFMFDYIPIIWTISRCCQPVCTHYKTNRTIQKLQIWIMYLLFVLYSCTLKHIQPKNAKNTNLIISLLILTVLCLQKWRYLQETWKNVTIKPAFHK